jgi:hypothetical protein
MTAGTTPKQVDLWCGTAAVCEGRVGEQSIWAVLYHQDDRLFGDELFADLFAEVGRRSVPPRIVATVMVLQRLQGLSDREAVEAFSFDARWKYACGGLAFDDPGFSHTVLVDMRARLAASARPERIFAVTMEAARQAGLVGVRRVLDSTPLYDAVATMDTVTLLARPSGAAQGGRGGVGGRAGGCLAVPTTTPAWPSRRSTGTTRRHERRWWMRAPGTPTRCWGPAGPPAAGGGGSGRSAAGRHRRPRPGAGRRWQLPDRP